jgi:hypothetical protein
MTDDAFKVAPESCQDVADFKLVCKKKLSPDLDNIPCSRIFLSLTDNGPPLQPGAPLPSFNTAETPIFISIRGRNRAIAQTHGIFLNLKCL